jgi:hypothetical protein
MPQIERWDNLPEGVRQHLIERMGDRAISVGDLNQLRLWVETRPQAPEGEWYKDFGSFKICGSGSNPKRSCSEGKLRRVKPSDQRVSADYSCLVASAFSHAIGFRPSASGRQAATKLTGNAHLAICSTTRVKIIVGRLYVHVEGHRIGGLNGIVSRQDIYTVCRSHRPID